MPYHTPLIDINRGVHAGEYVTDIIDRPMPLNRRRIVETQNSNYTVMDTIATVEASYGNYHLYKIDVLEEPLP